MNGVHFGVHQDQKFYKLDYWFLMKTRHIQSTQKGSLLNFCNILRKSVTTVFALYFNAKHSDAWWGSNHACCYLFLGGLKSAVSQETELIKWE